jgi:hypothetical protein
MLRDPKFRSRRAALQAAADPGERRYGRHGDGPPAGVGAPAQTARRADLALCGRRVVLVDQPAQHVSAADPRTGRPAVGVSRREGQAPTSGAGRSAL